MAMFSRRPASLAHLSDEAAARALSKHFGDVVEAAKELGVDRTDLRRLTWSNPAILDAAHERMSLFIFVQKDEIISGLYSRRASERRRAVDRMAANPALFGDVVGSSAFALLVPAGRGRRPNHSATAIDRGDEVRLTRERLEQEASAELEGERALERELEFAADRERVEVRPAAGRVVESAAAPDAWSSNAKYAHVRGLTRRR